MKIKKIRKSVTLNEELDEYLKDIAKNLGISQHALILIALNEYAEKNKYKKKCGEKKG